MVATPGQGRFGEGKSQGIDGRGLERDAIATADCDRVSAQALWPNAHVLHQASDNWMRTAGGSGDSGVELGYPRRVGGDLNLVEHVGLIWGYVRSGRDHAQIGGGPTDLADGVGDVDAIAVGDASIEPGLPLGEAVICRRHLLGGDHLKTVDVEVDVNAGRRTADAIHDGGDDSNAGVAGTTDGDGGVPGSGAGVPIGGDRKGG